MFNKGNLKAALSNEILLFKSMRPLFYGILVLTDILLPLLFIFLYKAQPDLFEGSVVEMIQYIFPFFCSVLVIFILRNFVDNYNCEIYFFYSKIKIKESLLILIVYLFELIIPMVVCTVISHEMCLEYVRVALECILFSSLAYMMMFLSMSTSLTIAVLFIYVLICIYYSKDIVQIFIYCNYGDISSADILTKTILQMIIGSIVFYLLGFVFNIIRCRRFSNNI